MFLKKSKAVSYIEVMLVLVIIGTVSALTIPSMKRHSQRHELGALAQTAYLMLNDALDNSILENGPTRNWTIKSTFLFEYFAPSMQCLESNARITITKNGMKFQGETYAGPKYIITVDVNGAEKGPNKTGKDQHKFEFDYKNSKIVPYSDTELLYKNNWKFTDELWYK